MFAGTTFFHIITISPLPWTAPGEPVPRRHYTYHSKYFAEADFSHRNRPVFFMTANPNFTFHYTYY